MCFLYHLFLCKLSYSWHSEVDDVVLFVVLFVEECYAQVVEVETDDRGYVPEPFAMAVQIVKHQDGVVANVFEDTVGWFCE